MNTQGIKADRCSSHGIVLPVPRPDPELAVVDVWRDNLLVPTFAVLTANELDQGVVYVGTFGEEEAAARTELVEEEQFLFLKERRG